MIIAKRPRRYGLVGASGTADDTNVRTSVYCFMGTRARALPAAHRLNCIHTRYSTNNSSDRCFAVAVGFASGRSPLGSAHSSQAGTWRSGTTPARHAGGPGFNPHCVHREHPPTFDTCTRAATTRLRAPRQFAKALVRTLQRSPFMSCLWPMVGLPSGQIARVVKGVDLRSTAGNCALVRSHS